MHLWKPDFANQFKYGFGILDLRIKRSAPVYFIEKSSDYHLEFEIRYHAQVVLSLDLKMSAAGDQLGHGCFSQGGHVSFRFGWVFVGHSPPIYPDREIGNEFEDLLGFDFGFLDAVQLAVRNGRLYHRCVGMLGIS